MSESFNKRRLKFIFKLSEQAGNVQPKFDGQDSNILELDGLRAIVEVRYAGTFAPTAEMRIYGMRTEDMAALTVLRYNLFKVNKNVVSILALNDENGMWSHLFSGDIIDALPDFSAMPDVCMTISANTMWTAQIKPYTMTNIAGTVDVAKLASDLITACGMTPVIEGTFNPLNKFYSQSSAAEQLRELQAAVDFDMFNDGTTITVVAKNKPLAGQAQVISAATGLVGYPTADSAGIQCTILFSPPLRNGSSVKIESDFTATNGEFRVYSMTHRLESLIQDGAWFTDISCNALGIGLP